jgi:hypothetical protein
VIGRWSTPYFFMAQCLISYAQGQLYLPSIHARLPNGLSFRVSCQNSECPPLLSQELHLPCPPPIPWFDHPSKVIYVEGCKLRSSSLCNFPYFPVTSCLLGPNIVLSILFGNITEPHDASLKTISIFDINLIPKITITFKWSVVL